MRPSFTQVARRNAKGGGDGSFVNTEITLFAYVNLKGELEMQPCHVLDMLLLLLLSCFSRVRLCAPHRRLPTRLCRP